jgi:hypothetical protein
VRTAATALVLLAAVVNLLPVLGVLSTARLEFLYGLLIQDPNLAILMRHRAVLFGIVGGLLAVSAFHPPLRALGIGAGLVSMLSFVAIAVSVGGYNALLSRVVWVDVVAALGLVIAAVLDSLAPAR